MHRAQGADWTWKVSLIGRGYADSLINHGNKYKTRCNPVIYLLGVFTFMNRGDFAYGSM